jgi:hypothetical protein
MSVTIKAMRLIPASDKVYLIQSNVHLFATGLFSVDALVSFPEKLAATI